MAFKPIVRGDEHVTDHMYASEIADRRPILATRLPCSVEEGDGDGDATMHRGSSAMGKFHEELNAGRGMQRGGR